MSRFYDGFQPKHAARCDSCQTSPIFGSRYKCNECDNFDLCEECYSIDKFGVANTSHNEAHSVKMILSNLDEKAYSVHTQCCNGCKTPKYPGNRYKCKVCSDFNLCERCHGDDRFAPFDNENVSHINSHEMEVCTFSEQKHHNYEQWKGMTIKLQHHFGSQLGTRYWDKHNSNNPEEWKNLGKKIGHALYGPPTVIPTDILIFGYNSTQEAHIEKLRSHVYRLSKKSWNDGTILINFIFVSFWSKKYESMLPLIRVYRGKPSNADKYYDLSYFVEPEGRTYDSWNDFIEHNQLPECKICYPSGGWYAPGENGYCLIAFSTSAECDTSRILANVGDILTTIAGVGATVVGIVGLFTPLAPLAATALAATAITTGAYGAGRGTYQLVDRATHGQSINPFDNKQSFFCWFSLIGSGFALGSSFGISYAASAGAAGRHVGQSMRIAINTAIIGSVTTNGFAIATGIFNVVDRFGQGDVPVLELFQLTASILFFTNTAVSMKMASTLVKNAQRAKLGNTRTLLHTDDQKLNFDMKILTDRNKALAGGNVKTGEMHGAEVTIARLNKLMVNSNWQNDFGHSNIGVSAQRHTSHPTHLANNAGIILQEAAENLAKQNQRTRFGGSQVGRQSESTIFAIPPHELDASLKNVVQQNGLSASGYVALPGTYYVFHVELDAIGQVVATQKFAYKNPTFKWNAQTNKAVHFQANLLNRKVISDFPPHAEIHVSYKNRTIHHFAFTQFIRTTNTTYDRFK